MNFKILLRYLFNNFWSFPQTLYINFHYLPFNHAIKFPILLRKTKLKKCKGKIIIDSAKIQTGMITIGNNVVSLYPDSGCIFENAGTIIFKGRARIGNDCAICVGKHGTLECGDDFLTNAGLKLVCANKIVLGEHASLGWETLIMDTSFHRTKNLDGTFRGKGYGEIIIGNNNWFGTKCMIFPGAKTPNFCIVAGGSFVNKDMSKYPTHIMLAGNPLEIKAEGVWRDVTDDKTIEF